MGLGCQPAEPVRFVVPAEVVSVSDFFARLNLRGHPHARLLAYRSIEEAQCVDIESAIMGGFALAWLDVGQTMETPVRYLDHFRPWTLR